MDESEPSRILEELVSLSLRAPELQMSQFLYESLRKLTSLSLGAPELQRGQFLNRILKEINQSEPESSCAPNGSVP